MMRHIRHALMVLPFLLVPMAGTGPAHAARPGAQSISLTEEDYWPAGTFTNEINGLISLYEASHPNVTITRTYVPVGSFTSKVLQQAAAHKLPDILILDNPTVQAIASTGALTDITPYTKGWSQLSSYYKSSLSTAMWKGDLYGFPVGNNDLALYYNEKMLKAAGISSPPATWADFRTAAKKLTTSKVYGFAFYTFVGQYSTAWNNLMAGSILAALPTVLLLVLAQRYIRAGLTTGAVRG